MSTERRWILYIDMLGTKSHIEKEKDEKLIGVIRKITSSASSFKLDYPGMKNDPHATYEIPEGSLNPEISNYSDHISVSYPSDYTGLPWNSIEISTYFFINSLLGITMQFYKKFLQQGFLMRGALTEGKLFHEGNSIIGQALIEAIMLEEETARYPRVIIPDEIMTLIRQRNSDPGKVTLKRDFDGIYYVDVLKSPYVMGVGDNLIKSFEYLQKKIEPKIKKYGQETKDINVLVKWLWLANKFDEALDFFYEKGNDDQKKELSKIYKFEI